MDLESASVQKALSKKFPRKRYFNEVDDCIRHMNHITEKSARNNNDIQACVPSAVSPVRNERQCSEYDLGRLRSLSPGNHDSYGKCNQLKDLQYSVEMQNNKRILYGKPYDFIDSSRISRCNDSDGGRMSRCNDSDVGRLSSLLAAKKYITSNVPCDTSNSVRSANISNEPLYHIQESENLKNYLQIAKTNIPNSQNVLLWPNVNDNLNSDRNLPMDPVTIMEKSYNSPNGQKFHPHINTQNSYYKQSYLAPLCNLPCSSPINYDSSVSETTSVTPICLRTASSVIIEAMSNKVCSNHQRRYRNDESEGDRSSPHYSYTSSPSSSKSSMESTFVKRQLIHNKKYKNEFSSAHRDLLGGISVSPSPTLGEPPELIRISSDDCDYADDSRSESEENNGDGDENVYPREVPDTSNMSVDEILDIIQLPTLSPFMADLDSVKLYLEPHHIGHINHLIKCYADAIFTVSVPSSVFESKTFSAIDYLDIHLAGVLQIYCIIFKSEDFLSLTVPDQITLLQSCVLPAHIALGFPLYRPDRKAWSIQSAMGTEPPVTYGIHNMLQVLPKSEVSRIVALHDASHKLNIDWTISVILLFIFMFTPIKRKIIDMEKIDNIRNMYVHLLYKYLEWKCGPENAPLVFPEILKLMDAILRLSQDLDDIELWLKEEEVEIVQNRIKCFNLQGISSFEFGNGEDPYKLITDDPPMEYVSFSNIHSKMSSVLLKSCSVASSEAESSDSEASFRIPSKMPSLFIDTYENSELITNQINQIRNK